MEITYKTLNKHIEKFKQLKSNNELFNKKHIKDYDVFKRYTSSRSENNPQQRICYNVRKNWPIVMNNDSNIPSEFLGTVLKNYKLEIGENEKVRGTLHAVDYWTKYGERCKPVLAIALISLEFEKVERFFAQNPERLYFGKFYPYRQPVNIVPVIEQVHKGAVASTIICSLLENFASLENRAKQNKSAVTLIREKLGKFADSKTLMALIHIARKMIVKETRWLPTTIDHSAISAEMVHLISSQYHLMPIERVEDYNAVKFESMFYELVRGALGTKNPKENLLENLSKILYAGTPITNIGRDLYGGPCTTIVRALCGGNVDDKQQIRDTVISEMEGESIPMLNRMQSKLGEMSYWYEFSSWVGKKSCFFTHRNTRGYFLMDNNNISKIFLLSENNEFLIDCIADIFYYAKAAEPGFYTDFGSWVDPKDRFEKWYEHHVVKLHGKVFIKNLGFSEDQNLPVSIDWYYNKKSRVKINNIFKMDTPVQPYSSDKYEISVDDELRVIKRTPICPIVLVNPREIRKIRKDVIPAGVTFKDSDLYYLYQAPILRVQKVAENVISSESEAEKFLSDIMTEDDTHLQRMLRTSAKEINPGKDWKRKIDEVIKDENWSKNHNKRFKVLYYGMVKCAQKRKIGESSYSSSPKKLKLTGGQVIDSEMKSGFIISTPTNIRVGGKNVTQAECFNDDLYVPNGIFSSGDPDLLVSNIKEAAERGLKKFYIHRRGRYFLFEEKKTKHELDSNVLKSLSTLEKQKEAFLSRKVVEDMLQNNV